METGGQAGQAKVGSLSSRVGEVDLILPLLSLFGIRLVLDTVKEELQSPHLSKPSHHHCKKNVLEQRA